MTVNTQNMRKYLHAFDFKRLFIEELGWNNPDIALPPAKINEVMITFKPIAEQGGMVILECSASDGNIPDSGLRSKIDKHVTQFAFEHILIFIDANRATSLWRWMSREQSKSGKAREHTYRKEQPGDALLQKLVGIAFEFADLDADGKASIVDVTGRVARAFDVERLTKRFYDQFAKEHQHFLAFLKGVQDVQGRDWYASVMLNRLMFLYFIQKKGFLNGDTNYLRTKLDASAQRGPNRYYRDFLLVLFFQGLACDERVRSAEVNRLLGNVPYLNGGIFLPHQIEEANDHIEIADAAFERLFDFFDSYTWHLDDRPLRQDNEINPDVLGYIFEKYINQKQMGAYYTKEDITNYICKYTILPFLLDKVGVNIAQAMRDVDPYIYDTVSTEDYLPTETEREYVARRKRYEQIRADFAAGKIATVNDLITYNLDISAFVEDYLRSLGKADATVLHRFYFEGLRSLTVLDPTCGSGAFLFAAMNILEPLYEICLDKIAQLLQEGVEIQPDTSLGLFPVMPAFSDFRPELERVSQHPNRRYFVYKSIIVNNLYGVDIMDEAVEICKLRLFLKLVAQVDDIKRIEPLPDVDFNIRAGNTLVGFATKDEIKSDLFAQAALPQIETLAGKLATFRREQLQVGVKPESLKALKGHVRQVQAEIATVLDKALMAQYGRDDLAAFRVSHKPFHWYAEFNVVMANGGFDVIVGNPPYVEYSKIRQEYTIRGYTTESCGNLYAFCIERCVAILRTVGRIGFVVQQPIVSTQRMRNAREILERQTGLTVVSTFDDRPSKLFDGMNHARIAIFLSEKNDATGLSDLYVTAYNKWYKDERTILFDKLVYIRSTQHKTLKCFPKIGSPLEVGLIDKVVSCKDTLQSWISPSETEYKVFYKITGVGHWMTVTTRPPRFFRQGEASSSSREQSISFPDRVSRDRTFAILNSTLFYWFYQVRTNCRDFNPSDYRTFPVPSSLQTSNLAELASRLQQSLDVSSTIINLTHNLTGAIQLEQFRPREAKPVIDEIDCVLAQHYGFTDEELDFIINYDIKYRMGKDMEDEDA